MQIRMQVQRQIRLTFVLIVCGSYFFCACGGSAPGAEKTSAASLPHTAAESAALPEPATENDLFTTLFGGDGETDSGEPRTLETYVPVASGEKVYEESGVTVDYSHTDQGYLMIKSKPHDKRLKVRIGTDAQTYNYDLPSDEAWQVYSFQQGSGEYSIRVLENVDTNLYAELANTTVSVTLADENLPFLYPSQFVMYTADSEALVKARELTKDITSQRKVVDTLYDYIGQNYLYDYDKAATVQTGYLPVVDETLRTEKGICFDFSVLLAVMCRGENIPCKLVIGTLMPEDILHAWNSILIDGEWQRYDPTFYGDTKHRETDYSPERVY